MPEPKKILSLVVKLLVGVGSIAIIYFRLKNDFTQDKLQLLSSYALSAQGILYFSICLLLIPLNWGIESYKWQLITKPVQRLKYSQASRSVYSGVCLGNLAPGRATEFVGKIIFFESENRANVTVLHFVNGMFQLSITIIAGLFALSVKSNFLPENFKWLYYTANIVGAVFLILLILSVYKIDFILKSITKKLSKEQRISDFTYSFQPILVLQLFFYSALRYFVFFFQFSLLLMIFQKQHLSLEIISGISVYFLITTLLPMISVLEAAIRAAIALLVFHDSGIQPSVLALVSVLIWLINIIIPSIAGYIFLLRENFDFSFRKNKT